MVLTLLLSVSNAKTLVHMMGIAKAAKNKGHKVVIFFNEESVKLLTQYPPLSELGVEMLACKTSCSSRGIREKDLIPGARMTSMAELVVMMEEMDRTLFLG